MCLQILLLTRLRPMPLVVVLFAGNLCQNRIYGIDTFV